MVVFELIILIVVTVVFLVVYYSIIKRNNSKRSKFYSSLFATDKTTQDIATNKIFGVSKFRNYSITLPYKHNDTTISDYSALVYSGQMAFAFRGSFYTLNLNNNASFLYIVIKGTPEGFVNDRNFEYFDVYDCITEPLYHVHIYYKGESKPSCTLIKELLAISYEHNINILCNEGYLTLYEKPSFFKSHYATSDNYNNISAIGVKIRDVIASVK